MVVYYYLSIISLVMVLGLYHTTIGLVKVLGWYQGCVEGVIQVPEAW